MIVQFIELKYVIPLTILLIFTILTYGFILFNDGLYFDSWMVDSWQRRKDWKIMKRYLSEVGMPYMFYVYKFNAYFKNRIFVSRFLAIISLFISSVYVYFISIYFNLLTPNQALILALLFLSYTGYQMIVDTVVALQYTVPISIFYSAVFLATYSHSLTGIYFYVGHFFSIILFFWSFNANSILVYYFGFIFFKLFLDINDDLTYTINMKYFFINVLYLLIPFIFWIIKEKYTPRHGYYLNYNRIQINPIKIIMGLAHSIRHSLEAAIIDPLLFIIKSRLILVILTLILIFNYFFVFDLRVDYLTSIIITIAGFGLFILAVIPYILVNQPINNTGWTTKNAMLIHLPSGMIIYGISSFIINDSKMFQGFLLFYLISTSLFNIRNSLYYLSVFIKDYSWLYKLKNRSDLSEIKIFQIIDNHNLKGDLSNTSQDYKSAYLFYMFDWIWKTDLSRFGICELEPKDLYSGNFLLRTFEKTTIPYLLSEVMIDSRQGRIIIKNNSKSSFYVISFKYILAKITKNKEKLKLLLDDVTDIEVIILN